MSSSNFVTINDIVIKFSQVGETIFVPIDPVCQILGINVLFAQKNIRNHSMLSKQWLLRPSLGSNGKVQSYMTLPFKYFLGWLMSVNTTNTDPEVEKIIIGRQEKVYDTFYQFLSAHPQKLI
jgi:hypothetical protein